MVDPIDAIAEGREVVWRETFNHPKYGELTFCVPKALTNADWIRHASSIDRIVRNQGGNPDDSSSRTTFFASAVAGILELMERPAVEERRIADPENEDHERLEVVRYDPLLDEDLGFPVEVWGRFFQWRNDLIDRAGELGKGSGETPGGESGGSLPAVTTSPSTILA